MNPESIDDPDLLLNAALDGELDAAGMMGIERRLAADPELAARYARLEALRAAIRRHAPREAAPEALRARIAAMAQTPPIAATPQRAPSARPTPWYQALAATLAIGLAFGAGADRLLVAQQPIDTTNAVVASYMRSRLSGQPVDVATNDRHNVKPWLAGKIGGGATVVDLSKDGFALVGGRVDVVDATPVATLVSQIREHFIDVTQWPNPNGAAGRERRDGFTVLRWSDPAHAYAAVSDLPAAELETFAAAFQKAAAAESEAK
jgi:anti-sigma factor RsiW